MDCDLAVKLNLKNTLQLQFSEIAVPIHEKIGVPSSPQVWASFLCAKLMKKDFDRKNNFVFSFIKKAKKLLPRVSLGLSHKAGGALCFPELNTKSWVDLPNVKEFNAPYFSYDNIVMRITAEFAKTKNLEEYQKQLESAYQLKSKQALEQIKKEMNTPECDIFFTYLHFPDGFNHAWYHDQQKTEYYHKEIDNFVSKVLEVTEGIHVIIISDHGFDFSKGVHSNFGFISSNRFMNFPKSIIEFGKLIYKYAGETE